MNEVEFKMVEIERVIDQDEEDGHRKDILQSYAMRIHCVLILNGGFVEEVKEPDYKSICSYEMIAQANASQKEFGRYEINRWTLVGTCSNARSSHSRSQPTRYSSQQTKNM